MEPNPKVSKAESAIVKKELFADAPLNHDSVRSVVLEDLVKFSKGKLDGTSSILFCGCGLTYALLQLRKRYQVHLEVIDMGMYAAQSAHHLLQEIQNAFLTRNKEQAHVVVLDHVECIKKDFPELFFRGVQSIVAAKKARLIICAPRPDDAFRIVGNKAKQTENKVTTIVCSFASLEDAAYAVATGFATRFLEDALLEMAMLSPNPSTKDRTRNLIDSYIHDEELVYQTAHKVYEHKEKGLTKLLRAGNHTVPADQYKAVSFKKLGRGLLWLGSSDKVLLGLAHAFVQETADQQTITDRDGNKRYVWDVPLMRGIETLSTSLRTSNDINVRKTEVIEATAGDDGVEEERTEAKTYDTRRYFTQVLDNLCADKRQRATPSIRTDPDVIQGIATNLIKTCVDTPAREGFSDEKELRDVETLALVSDLVLWEFQSLFASGKGTFHEDIQEGHEYIVEHISNALSLDLHKRYQFQITPHCRETFQHNRIQASRMVEPLLQESHESKSHEDLLRDALRREWLR